MHVDMQALGNARGHAGLLKVAVTQNALYGAAATEVG